MFCPKDIFCYIIEEKAMLRLSEKYEKLLSIESHWYEVRNIVFDSIVIIFHVRSSIFFHRTSSGL